MNINITQRQVVIALISMTCGMTLILGLLFLFQGGFSATTPYVFGATLLFGVLLAIYWRGWEPVRYVMLISFCLLAGFATPEPYVTTLTSLVVLLIPAIAALLGPPPWIIGSTALVVGILIARAAGAPSPYADPVSLILVIFATAAIVLGRLIADTALRRAETNAQRVEAALQQAEQQADELARRADQLSRQNEQQQRLLDLVATLETPAVNLAEGVLFAPIVGHLDSRRADHFTTILLRNAAEQRAGLVIIDLAGVTTVDTQVAQALVRTAQALRLLGCRVTLSGISASIATTITHLGVDLGDILVSRTPQEALAQYRN